MLYLVSVKTARWILGLIVISRIISGRVIPIISVKGGYAYSRRTYIIISKFYNGEKMILIIHLFINKGPEPRLKLLVKDLSLLISSKVEGSTYPSPNINKLKKLLLQTASKA